MPTLRLPTRLAAVVRPTVVIESHLRDRTPRPAEVPEQEAEIRWGQPSSFQWSVTNPPTNDRPGIVVKPGGGDDDEEEPGDKILLFEEMAVNTVTEDVRVENPDDESQYVIVERILDIFFLAPPELPDAIAGLKDGTIRNLIYQYKLHPEDRPGSPS
jgi:hypothetical protein